MSGKNTTFPDGPATALPGCRRTSSLLLSLLLEKGGRVLLLSTPTAFSIRYRHAEFLIAQFETGAVALANFASRSDDVKKLLVRSCPFSSISSSFTLAIIIGMSMPTGQISLQRPQEMQRCE